MIKLNLARNCLRYIIKAYNISEIYMPFYSCNSLWNAVRKENCKMKFYHIGEDFLPVKQFGKYDFILYINYFGLFDKNCEELHKKYPNLIIDNTQAFYSEARGLCSFNSLRKFFKVQNGAYLFTEKFLNEVFEVDSYLYDPVGIREEYSQFVQNEILLNSQNIKKIYPHIEEKMQQIDFQKDKKIRKEKFAEYHKKYGEYNLLKLPIDTNNIPYCYPLSTKNKDIQKELLNINNPLLSLWGEMPQNYIEHKFLNNTVALPLN